MSGGGGCALSPHKYTHTAHTRSTTLSLTTSSASPIALRSAATQINSPRHTMPTFCLHIKADLENIAKLEVPAGSRFCIDVKESAGSESRERVYVSSTDEHDLSGSKGTANFVMKFAKDSRHECSINVMQLKGVTRAVTEDDDGKWVPVVAFECRGIEPTAFHPEDGFVVQTRGKKVFTEVDLSEGEWVEFDDKINESVGIYGLESKWELHKGK